MRIALPAILPSSTILMMSPAAFRADAWPTMPSDDGRASSNADRPSPRMCECEPMRSRLVMSERVPEVVIGGAA